MISLIQPLPAGNALRIFREVPAGASQYRLLRKVSNTFSGQDDPDALVVSTNGDRAVVDLEGLNNGTLYYYRPYYFVGGSWGADVTVSATPAASYTDRGGDVLTLVRERLDLGLQVELVRGALTHEQGHIQVLTAPPIFEETVFPVVTVHLQNEQPAERGLGEMPVDDMFDAEAGAWVETEGWLARVQLTIMGWSINPDERIELRKALRRLVVANLPIFDFAGMTEVEFSQQDTEDFGSYTVPVYQAMCTLTCLAPVMVSSNVGLINEVITTTTAE